nr:hypothetical protein [Tanacetum cinerariifolium]
MINQDIKDSKVYKTYLNYATRKVPPKKARKFKKHASPKLKTVLASPKEPTQKGKRVKRPTKKAITTLTTGVVIRYTPEVPDEQTGKTKDTSEGTGMKPGVPDVSKEDSFDSDDDSWGNSKDENDDFNDEDDDGSNDDDNGNDDDSGNDDDGDYEEEEQDEEYVCTPEKEKFNDEEKMYVEENDDVAKELYLDLNITQGLRDTDMNYAEQGGEDQQNASYKSGVEQEEVDGQVTLTTVYDKTEVVSAISSIVDKYLASKVKEAVNVAVQLQSNKLKEEDEAENLEFFDQVDLTMKVIIKEQVKAQVFKIMPQIENHITKSLGAEVLDEDLFAGSDRGMKRRKSSKDVEPSKGLKSSSSSKGTQSQPKSSDKSTQAEEPEFEVIDTEMQQDQWNESCHIGDQPDNEAAPTHDWFWKPNKPSSPNRAWNKSKSVDFRLPQKWISTISKIDNLTQEILVRPAFNLLKGTCKSFAKLEYHLEECYKAFNDRLDWHNSEGREYPFDLSKPLPLIEDRGLVLFSAS